MSANEWNRIHREYLLLPRICLHKLNKKLGHFYKVTKMCCCFNFQTIIETKEKSLVTKLCSDLEIELNNYKMQNIEPNVNKTDLLPQYEVSQMMH